MQLSHIQNLTEVVGEGIINNTVFANLRLFVVGSVLV